MQAILVFLNGALKHMWRRHRLRNALSSLGVMCGVASVLAMLTIGEGARRETMLQISQLGLGNVIVRSTVKEVDDPAAWREMSLLMKDRDSLNGLARFDQIAVIKELEGRPGELDGSFGITVLATEPSLAEIHGLRVAEGRFLHREDIRSHNRVCVIGSDVAQSLDSYSRIGSTITLDDEIYTLVGRIAPVQWSAAGNSNIQVRNFNQCVFVPAVMVPDDDVSEIIVHVRPGDDVIAAGALVERSVGLSRWGLKPAQIVVPLALLKQAEESQQVFDVILGSIAAISLVVGGIGIMNIMLASVAERTAEIGLRRAIGATRRDILIQFLIEAVCIGIVGAFTGILLGMLVSLLVSTIGGWPTALTGAALLWPIMMSIMVTAAAGLYPAWKASHVDPIVALRQSAW